MASINFFSEDLPFTVPHPRKTSAWIKQVIANEGYRLKSLSYVFCSDEYLLGMNVEYLSHKTLTDIITFATSEERLTVEGDIFISIDRVKDNAAKFGAPFDTELRRVMIHGVLHLIGYKDKSDRDQIRMRKKEDTCLSLWS